LLFFSSIKKVDYNIIKDVYGIDSFSRQEQTHSNVRTQSDGSFWDSRAAEEDEVFRGRSVLNL